jgi:hypothetical protein
MKQEKLRLLAEWIEPKCKTIQDLIVDALEKMDSRPIDMLEDKMIEELNVDQYYWLSDSGRTKFIIKFTSNDYQTMHEGRGKTKNLARLNAIINYVEKK